jgi:hypothetical protein
MTAPPTPQEAEIAGVAELRERFVHDFQYRYQKQSDHYTIVALFAQEIAKEHLQRAQGER